MKRLLLVLLVSGAAEAQVSRVDQGRGTASSSTPWWVTVTNPGGGGGGGGSVTQGTSPWVMSSTAPLGVYVTNPGGGGGGGPATQSGQWSVSSSQMGSWVVSVSGTVATTGGSSAATSTVWQGGNWYMAQSSTPWAVTGTFWPQVQTSTIPGVVSVTSSAPAWPVSVTGSLPAGSNVLGVTWALQSTSPWVVSMTSTTVTSTSPLGVYITNPYPWIVSSTNPGGGGGGGGTVTQGTSPWVVSSTAPLGVAIISGGTGGGTVTQGSYPWYVNVSGTVATTGGSGAAASTSTVWQGPGTSTLASAWAVTGTVAIIGTPVVAVTTTVQAWDAAQPTTSTSGGYREPISTLDGMQYVRFGGPVTFSFSASTTLTTILTVQGTLPGANLRYFVSDFSVIATSSTVAAPALLQSCTSASCAGTCTTVWADMPPTVNSATDQHFSQPLKLPLNTSLCFLETVAGTKWVSVNGFTAP